MKEELFFETIQEVDQSGEVTIGEVKAQASWNFFARQRCKRCYYMGGHGVVKGVIDNIKIEMLCKPQNDDDVKLLKTYVSTPWNSKHTAVTMPGKPTIQLYLLECSVLDGLIEIKFSNHPSI